jgi:gp16 family phage-associated protein
MSTPEQVRERFRREGKPLSQWARENGFKPQCVYRVMAGIDKGYYGKAHTIAVMLGLKPADGTQPAK